tara:strand:- start:1220 stop:1777 length:558 start_codon:yes stop_codon:yes gene_type:complete
MINNPVRQNWRLYSSDINSEEVDNLVKFIENTYPEVNAKTFNNASDDIRKSKIRFVHNPDIQRLLFGYVENAAQTMGVHVINKADLQYTEYHGTDKGHYTWHHDVDWNRSDGYDRKLSITVQLSNPNEYEGGDFEFSETETPKLETCKLKGSVLIFPSYLQHRVSPVTSGIRKSLVAWFEGPMWR